MENLSDYIEKFKDINGLETDTELADYLGVQRQRVLRMKKEGFITDDQCATIANGIGEHPALLMIARELMKEKNSWQVAYWKDAFNACKQNLVRGNKDYRKLIRSLFYRLSVGFVKVQPFLHVPTEKRFCSTPKFIIAH